MKFQPIIHPSIAVVCLLLVVGFFLWKTYHNKEATSSKVFYLFRMLLISLLVFVIELRPMRPSYTADVMLKNIDVLFVLDNTISMYAQDSAFSSRMKEASDDIIAIMDELDGSNFALIRFDNTSQILSPFTQDSRNIKDILDVISYPDTYYANGSSLNTPYDDMKGLLESSYEKQDRTTVVFFLSDGEITDNSTLMSYADLKNYIDDGAVLGYGSEEGGKMYVGVFTETPLMDPTTLEDAISRIDTQTLQQLANDLGIDFERMPNNTKRENLIKSVINRSSSILGDGDVVTYDDIYYFFIWPLLALLIYEGIIFIRKGKF